MRVAWSKDRVISGLFGKMIFEVHISLRFVAAAVSAANWMQLPALSSNRMGHVAIASAAQASFLVRHARDIHPLEGDRCPRARQSSADYPSKRLLRVAQSGTTEGN